MKAFTALQNVDFLVVIVPGKVSFSNNCLIVFVAIARLSRFWVSALSLVSNFVGFYIVTHGVCDSTQFFGSLRIYWFYKTLHSIECPPGIVILHVEGTLVRPFVPRVDQLIEPSPMFALEFAAE